MNTDTIPDHPDSQLVAVGFVPEPMMFNGFEFLDLEAMLSPESKESFGLYQYDLYPRRAIFHLNRTRRVMTERHDEYMMWINVYWSDHRALTPKLERLLQFLAAEYLNGFPVWESVYGDDQLEVQNS